MQTKAVERPARLLNGRKVSGWLDLFFSQPYFYAVFTLLAINIRGLQDAEELIVNIWHLQSFPVFRILIYAGCTLTLAAYLLRWLKKDIQRKNAVLLCLFGMFMFLAVMTMVFQGASGYHLNWHAGFMLMLMIDMGLQRERESLLRGMTGAFEFWLYLNAFCILLFPNSIQAESGLPGWVLDIHVYYYRVVFPAIGMALLRYFVLGKAWRVRTIALIAVCLFTVVIQRGGTALLGFAMLIAMTVWCARRALPRYLTPFVCTLGAVILFVLIHYFKLPELFSVFLEQYMGKSVTLTGRTELWEKVMQVIFKNPLTGVGYLPVAYTREFFGGWGYTHTHNQMLEIMLHGGLVAVALYMGAVWFASKEAIRYRRSAAVKALTLTVNMFIFMGVAEIFHNDPIYYALFIFLSRADCLTKDVKQLPRISIIKRIKRDLTKKA